MIYIYIYIYMYIYVYILMYVSWQPNTLKIENFVFKLLRKDDFSEIFFII
jgi:hypothetical protein